MDALSAETTELILFGIKYNGRLRSLDTEPHRPCLETSDSHPGHNGHGALVQREAFEAIPGLPHNQVHLGNTVEALVIPGAAARWNQKIRKKQFQ